MWEKYWFILKCKNWTTIKHCTSKYTNTPNGRGHTTLELSLKGAYLLFSLRNVQQCNFEQSIGHFLGSLTIVHSHETEKKKSVVGAIFR